VAFATTYEHRMSFRHFHRPRGSAQCRHHPQRKAIYGPVARRAASKVHAIIDSKGLPVRLRFVDSDPTTAGLREVPVQREGLMMPTGSGTLRKEMPRQISRRDAIAVHLLPTSIEPAMFVNNRSHIQSKERLLGITHKLCDSRKGLLLALTKAAFQSIGVPSSKNLEGRLD